MTARLLASLRRPAFRIEAKKQLATLRPITLRGAVPRSNSVAALLPSHHPLKAFL